MPAELLPTRVWNWNFYGVRGALWVFTGVPRSVPVICYLAHTPYNSAQHALRLIPHSHHGNPAAVAGFHHRVGHVDLAFVNLGVSKGMCPLRGERARGLAPSSAGAGEASFRADPATVGWFKSSRQLHTMLVPARSPLNGSWRPDNTLNLFPASTQQ